MSMHTPVGDADDLLTTVPGAEFARHLARHGVAVTGSDLPQVGSIADTLRSHAGLVRTDLMVMGAYRHSRARECVFGGVTRSLLMAAQVPLFLAHRTGRLIMIRKQPTRTSSIRAARRRKAILQTLRPAIAPTRTRPEDDAPISPVPTEDLEPFDESDLRA